VTICDVTVALCNLIAIETQKKRKYGNENPFYIDLHLRDGLGIEFTAC